MELLSRWSCWLCGMKRVPTLPSECVPQIGDPLNPMDDSALCPSCACSNPDDVVDCVGCGDGIEMLTGYNPYSARHPVPSFTRRR